MRSQCPPRRSSIGDHHGYTRVDSKPKNNHKLCHEDIRITCITTLCLILGSSFHLCDGSFAHCLLSLLLLILNHLQLALSSSRFLRFAKPFAFLLGLLEVLSVHFRWCSRIVQVAWVSIIITKLLVGVTVQKLLLFFIDRRVLHNRADGSKWARHFKRRKRPIRHWLPSRRTRNRAIAIWSCCVLLVGVVGLLAVRICWAGCHRIIFRKSPGNSPSNKLVF